MSSNALPVALITGSTSGIGEEIARKLSGDGFAIVLHSRSSISAGHALAVELGKAIYIQADLANDSERVRLIRETVAWLGRLDVLVNNAVAPGLVDTPMTTNWTSAQQVWREWSPMKRAAKPGDIAQIVSMLVASDYLTGEVIVADGGLNLT